VESVVLLGKTVRLEPVERRHIAGLVAASDPGQARDPSLYQWSLVPRGSAEVTEYVETAIAWRGAGTAVPFAIVRLDDGVVIGSTRFWNMERWRWPEGHPRHGRGVLDCCEIGFTWLTRSAIRTAANTEAKTLMLTHAFEVWETLRVWLCTDSRNLRSRAAIERIGGKLEGILRSHRMAADYIPRDSLCFSIIAAEWPDVKLQLSAKANRDGQ
jgi:RimJ/RimL family protein N-acetyltransferase